jgi:hypothetical protein
MTSSRGTIVSILAAAAAVLLCAFCAAATANPAVDEYKTRFPNDSGKSQEDSSQQDSAVQAPAPVTSSLPPPVTHELKKHPHGKALATVATSPDLGAPVVHRETTSGSSSLPGAIVRSLLDPVVLLILIGMAAMAIGSRRLAGDRAPRPR